jgi:putative endonuclease
LRNFLCRSFRHLSQLRARTSLVLRRLRSTRSHRLHPHALGHEGERRAAQFLKKKGLKLLLRNFRPQYGGEVDLVFRVRHQSELVFVEVKTRSDPSFAAPHQAVDSQKRQGLILAAEEWLRLLDRPEVTARFDIVEVLAPTPTSDWQIRHLENAFLARETLHPGSWTEDLKTHRASTSQTPRRDRP